MNRTRANGPQRLGAAGNSADCADITRLGRKQEFVVVKERDPAGTVVSVFTMPPTDTTTSLIAQSPSSSDQCRI